MSSHVSPDLRTLHQGLHDILDPDSIFFEFRRSPAAREFRWVAGGQTPDGTSIVEDDPSLYKAVAKLRAIAEAP